MQQHAQRSKVKKESRKNQESRQSQDAAVTGRSAGGLDFKSRGINQRESKIEQMPKADTYLQ